MANGSDGLATLKQIIPIETSSEVQISHIYKVEQLDNMLIIQDDNGIYSFTKLGKFRCKYGNKENAANEYMRASTFFINNNHQLCIIDSEKNKILTYDLNGNFISREKYDGDILSLVHNALYVGEDNIICENYMFKDFSNIYTIVNLKEKTSFVYDSTQIKRTDGMQYFGKHTISKNGESILYVKPFSNKVFAYEQQSDYEVKSKMNMLNEKDLSSIKGFSFFTYKFFLDKGNFMGFTDVFETSNKNILFSSQTYYVVIDKESKECKRYNYTVDNKSKNSPLINILSSYQNNLIGVIDPEVYIYANKNIQNHDLKQLINLADKAHKSGDSYLLIYNIK